VPLNTIQQYEQGERGGRVSLESAAKLAKSLGVAIELIRRMLAAREEAGGQANKTEGESNHADADAIEKFRREIFAALVEAQYQGVRSGPSRVAPPPVRRQRAKNQGNRAEG